tara:strand:+ start:255 stop:404 length:150 start_codon:yes stop_codon:yes gene_type:complete
MEFVIDYRFLRSKMGKWSEAERILRGIQLVRVAGGIDKIKNRKVWIKRC